MIITNDVNSYASLSAGSHSKAELSLYEPPQDSQGESSRHAPPSEPEQAQQTLSRVMTETDGSTIMRYTTMTPSGTIMRKNVTLHEADATQTDPFYPLPMLRRRSDVYEGMMQIF